MENLIQTLASIRSEKNNFIERLDLIEGYSASELREIETRYNLSIHGQFQTLLITMGKCSGGLLLGGEIRLFNELNQPNSSFFGKEDQNAWQTSYDLQDFIQEHNFSFLEQKFFHLASRNESCIHYFLLTQNKDNTVYEFNECVQEIKFERFGTLTDFLVFYREELGMDYSGGTVTGQETPELFYQLTTGRLL